MDRGEVDRPNVEGFTSQSTAVTAMLHDNCV